MCPIREPTNWAGVGHSLPHHIFAKTSSHFSVEPKRVGWRMMLSVLCHEESLYQCSHALLFELGHNASGLEIWRATTLIYKAVKVARWDVLHWRSAFLESFTEAVSRLTYINFPTWKRNLVHYPSDALNKWDPALKALIIWPGKWDQVFEKMEWGNELPTHARFIGTIVRACPSFFFLFFVMCAPLVRGKLQFCDLPLINFSWKLALVCVWCFLLLSLILCVLSSKSLIRHANASSVFIFKKKTTYE